MSIVELIGFDSFSKKVEELGTRAREGEKTKRSVFVGVTGTSDSNMVIIAAANEFGTQDGRIPSRPFLRNALNNPQLARFVSASASAYMKGAYSLDETWNRIGAYTTGLVQRSIGSNIQPENAPSTVARKGSSRTLINTGRLRQSFTWVLR